MHIPLPTPTALGGSGGTSNVPAAHATSHTNGADDIAVFGTGTKGLVPNTSDGNATKYLSAAGTFTVPAGGGGGLAAADVFPAGNTVYVEPNAGELAKLVAQGCLAYSTIYLAMASWRPAGAAYVRYGAPTVNNPALILLGIGVHNMPTELTWDVPNLTVQGVSRSGTIVRCTAGSEIWQFSINANDPTICNLTYEGANMGDMIRTISTRYLRMYEVDASLCFGQYLMMAGGKLEMWDCTFNGSQYGGFSFTGAMDAGSIIQDIELLNIGVHGSDSNVFVMNGGTYPGLIKDCTISSGVSVVGMSTGTGFTGRFENCRMQINGNCIEQCGSNSQFINSTFLANGGNFVAIALNAATGIVIRNCTCIGSGSGKAITGGTITAEITHSRLRMPTGDVPGSSITATITNAAGTPLNVELLAATTT